jgi:glycosyltransferase involved in cell wall biosynthesis
MNDAAWSAIPPPADGCRMTVCLPARDEAAFIPQTLAALTAGNGLDGRPLPAGFFDVIVYANNCTDDTVAIVRACAARTPRTPIFVVDERLAAGLAHIGTARKRVLDFAAARFFAAGRPDGIVASIDSDTLAGDDWVAWMAHEMQGRDAVAGRVTIAEEDQERLLAPVRLLYARELTYRRVLADVEALIDPRPEDPAPRHGSFVGASFAISACAYVAAGGLPPRKRLEDVAFVQSLHRIDARVRYSLRVRATTSARLDARVDGGFGTFIADLHACVRRGESFTVEHPRRTLDDLEVRAAVRRLHLNAERPGDLDRIALLLRVPQTVLLAALDRAEPAGATIERLIQLSASTRPQFEPVRVEVAIAALRDALAQPRHSVPFDERTQTLGAG